MFDQQPDLRVDHQPSLGADLAFQRSEPTPGTFAPSPNTVSTILLLNLVREEITALRKDLYNRTVAGRTKRAWHATVRGWRWLAAHTRSIWRTYGVRL